MTNGKQYFAFWIILLLLVGCDPSRTTSPNPTDSPATILTSPAITHVISSSINPTMFPTQVPTATLAPTGEIQSIPGGHVNLGDTSTMTLGFNLDAGGAIGSLMYHGTEMIDDADYGRYFQFSPYDGADRYVCDSASCFVTWGWNPLQAGSADGVGAPVQEYRRWEDGIYIKALGQEWGHLKGVSDVTYETWAWDRGRYFEVHIRMTHTGDDIHAYAGAESPAAYFGAALPIEYGYTGTEPFTADETQQYHMVTGDMSNNANPPIFPSENWMAFGDQQGNGLILAVPVQPKLSGEWSMVFIQNAYPHSIGYLTTSAYFETPPGFVFDLTYYLIPGNIQNSRSIVYDLIPHTTWTFDLNSAEGWTNPEQAMEVRDGVLSTNLTQTSSLTSMPNLNFYGSHFPTIEVTAQTADEDTDLCLDFVTLTNWSWDPSNSVCTQLQPGNDATYRINPSTNPVWMDGLITQIRLRSSETVTLDIDQIIITRELYGWEFNDPSNPDGWLAWNQMGPLQVKDGNLTSKSTGNDPYMGSSGVSVDANIYTRIEIRMRTESGNDAQVFFITDHDLSWDEAKSKHFSTISDGEFHTYNIDMSGIPAWKDRIQQIRLDPMVNPGSFEIEYIHIVGQ
jgi:hypothetical protein